VATNDLTGLESGTLAGELRLLVGRLARGLRRHDDGALTPGQRSALASVDRIGPLRLGDLAVIEAVSPPTLTRIVQRLEDKGLVARRADLNDARAVQLEVTRAGQRMLTEMRAERSRALAVAIEGLDERDRAALAGALPALHRVVDALFAEDEAQ
jgi:DNA-binding MarR family transcriptional regulator